MLENVFVKFPLPWHDLIISHVEQPLNKLAYVEMTPKILLPIWCEKLLEKGFSILYGGRHYALGPMENQARVCSPSVFARKCGLNLVNILNLAKRSVWQNSGLRHYIRLWLWPVKTSWNTPLRLKLFFIFKCN